jgi:uncharacterized protein with PQ loop repeat
VHQLGRELPASLRGAAVTESVLAVAAATWGIAMGLSPLLQIRQMRLTRSSRDVSVPYFLVLNVGFLLWFSYGIASSNLAVALPNVVAFTVGMITIVTARRLRQVGYGNGAGSSSSSANLAQ